MFVDYYAVLGISLDASVNEIRSAYRKASIRWHPDRNEGVDTTAKMQDINEAYAILKDESKRARYDVEYRRFAQQRGSTNNHPTNESVDDTRRSDTEYRYDYDVHDENLRSDINDARGRAKEMVDEFMRNLRRDTHNAAVGAWENSYGYVIVIVIGLLVSLIISMFG